tara:strand:+ start:265 stop:894 length:630 start_codon:yes stop_codon:yes gene_type:complete
MKPELIEISGRYRNLVTQISRLILERIKVSNHKRLSYEVIMFKEVINKNIPLHFYLGLQTVYSNDLYVTGDAYNPTELISDQIPYIEISIKTNGKKQHLSQIVLKLSNTIRHELEHITQSGLNTLPGKYLPDDQHLRKVATKKDYLLLDKEIPAMLHGLYNQAKKEHVPFLDKMNEYLNETYLLESDIDSIKNKWISKAKELNLWKNMM